MSAVDPSDARVKLGSADFTAPELLLVTLASSMYEVLSCKSQTEKIKERVPSCLSNLSRYLDSGAACTSP